MVSIFLTLIYILITITSKKPVCPTIYKNIASSPTPNNCTLTETKEALTTIYVKNCPQGTICTQDFEHPEDTKCDSITLSLLPGLYCANMTQCRSLVCEKNVCQGQKHALSFFFAFKSR